MWREISSPLSFVIFQHMVPMPSMLRPLPMPFRTVFEVGCTSMKSDLLFEMQLDAPVSIQIGIPPGKKFII